MNINLPGLFSIVNTGERKNQMTVMKYYHLPEILKDIKSKFSQELGVFINMTSL